MKKKKYELQDNHFFIEAVNKILRVQGTDKATSMCSLSMAKIGVYNEEK